MSENFSWRRFETADAFWGYAPFFRPTRVAPAQDFARACEFLPPEQGAGGQNPPASGIALFESIFALGPGLVDRKGVAVAETLEGFDASRFWRRSGENFCARAPSPKIAKIEGDVLWLRRFGETQDFFALLDLIPRLAVAARFCDLSALRIAVPELDGFRARRLIDILALFGVAESQILVLGDEARWFRRLILPFPLVVEGVALSPAAVEVLGFLPARYKMAAGPTKIYLTDADDDPHWRPALENLGFFALDAAAERFSALAPLLGAASCVAAGPKKLAFAALAPGGARLVLLDGAAQAARFEQLAALKQGVLIALAGGEAAALVLEPVR